MLIKHEVKLIFKLLQNYNMLIDVHSFLKVKNQNLFRKIYSIN